MSKGIGFCYKCGYQYTSHAVMRGNKPDLHACNPPPPREPTPEERVELERIQQSRRRAALPLAIAHMIGRISN